MNEKIRQVFDPIVDIFASFGLKPNHLTILGFVLTFIPAFFIAKGFFLLAGIILILVSSTDFLDGQLARKYGMVTSFGAFLDSTLDRISEFILVGAYLYHFRDDLVTALWLYLLLMFSILVSYTRARGEGLGVSVTAGPMNRTGRLLTYILLTILGEKIFIKLMPLFVLLVGFTVVRRCFQLYNSLSTRGGK